jgi:hypothetical protein
MLVRFDAGALLRRAVVTTFAPSGATLSASTPRRSGAKADAPKGGRHNTARTMFKDRWLD